MILLHLPSNTLQQYLPLAICDEGCEAAEERSDDEARTSLVPDWKEGKMKRIEWKYLPITVLKRFAFFVCVTRIYAKMLQQHLPLAVLKRLNIFCELMCFSVKVATVPTACGIETTVDAQCGKSPQDGCNSAYRSRYWNCRWIVASCLFDVFKVATVLTACGMRRRVRGSRGTKWRWGPHISSPWLKGRENKGDKVIVLTACGIETRLQHLHRHKQHSVATAPTARGMRRRVRGSRGAKRRWGPHISSPWPKGRENKGDEVTVLTACGIETRSFSL